MFSMLQIRLMFMVGVPLNTTALPGEQYPVAATVVMNSGDDTWVGYRDFTVLAENDESNVVVCTTPYRRYLRRILGVANGGIWKSFHIEASFYVQLHSFS